MGATEFGLNDALAVTRWRTDFETEPEKIQYFRKFMGTGPDAMIKIVKDLEKQAGQEIITALSMKLSGAGVDGDDIIEGTTAIEGLDFFNDTLKINQKRKGTKSKGKMSEQRVAYNIRARGRQALSVWFAEEYDEQIIMALSGARGVDTSFHNLVGYTGHAGNTFLTPDTAHIVYGGDATAKSDLDSSDIISLDLIDRLVAKVETMDPQMLPFMIDGEKKYVLLMHTFQAFDLRRPLSDNDWADIQKRMGAQSLLFKNALGVWNDVILHKHRNVVRFSDYGASSTTTAARALFLGAQAGIMAWGGQEGGVGRYSWDEKALDAGNQTQIVVGAIFGVKKARYNSKDYSVVAVDTYYDDPNS